MTPAKKRIGFGLKYFWMNFLSRDRQLKLLAFLSKSRSLRRTISFNDHLRDFRKVLILLPDKPFEITLTQRAIVALKEHRPGMTIDVIAESSCSDIIRSNPCIDTGLLFHEPEFRYNHPAFRELVKTVQGKGYDACFLLKAEPGPLDLLLCAVSMAPLRIGFPSRKHDPFVNLVVRPRKDALYEGDKYESLLKALGVKMAKARLKWNIPKTTERDVESVLTEAGYDIKKRLIGVNLSPAVTGRTLSDETLKTLIDTLGTLEGIEIIPFRSEAGGKGKTPPLPGISKILVSFPEDKIATAAAFAARCACLVSQNNLFYQVAVMMGCPVVGVFESLEHRRWGIVEPGHAEVVSATRLKDVPVQEIADKVAAIVAAAK